MAKRPHTAYMTTDGRMAAEGCVGGVCVHGWIIIMPMAKRRGIVSDRRTAAGGERLGEPIITGDARRVEDAGRPIAHQGLLGQRQAWPGLVLLGDAARDGAHMHAAPQAAGRQKQALSPPPRPPGCRHPQLPTRPPPPQHTPTPTPHAKHPGPRPRPRPHGARAPPSPPRAVPSSFVRMRPDSLTASLNSRAWFSMFRPALGMEDDTTHDCCRLVVRTRGEGKPLNSRAWISMLQAPGMQQQGEEGTRVEGTGGNG